jgi:hypothetical protein
LEFASLIQAANIIKYSNRLIELINALNNCYSFVNFAGIIIMNLNIIEIAPFLAWFQYWGAITSPEIRTL